MTRQTLALLVCALLLINAADAGKRRRSTRKKSTNAVSSTSAAAQAPSASVGFSESKALDAPEFASAMDQAQYQEFTETGGDETNGQPTVSLGQVAKENSAELDEYDIVSDPRSPAVASDAARSSPVNVAHDANEQAARDVMSWPSSPEPRAGMQSPGVRSIPSTEKSDFETVDPALEDAKDTVENCDGAENQGDAARWQVVSDASDGEPSNEVLSRTPEANIAHDVHVLSDASNALGHSEDQWAHDVRNSSGTDSKLSSPKSEVPFELLAENPFSNSSDAAESMPSGRSDGMVAIGGSAEDSDKRSARSLESEDGENAREALLDGEQHNAVSQDSTPRSNIKESRDGAAESGAKCSDEGANKRSAERGASRSIQSSDLYGPAAGSRAARKDGSSDVGAEGPSNAGIGDKPLTKFDMALSDASRPGSPWDSEVHRAMGMIATDDNWRAQNESHDVSSTDMDSVDPADLQGDESTRAAMEEMLMYLANFEAAVAEAENTCAASGGAYSCGPDPRGDANSSVQSVLCAPHTAPGYSLLVSVAPVPPASNPTELRGMAAGEGSSRANAGALSVRRRKSACSDSFFSDQRVTLNTSQPLKMKGAAIHVQIFDHASDTELSTERPHNAFLPRQFSNPEPVRHTSFERARANMRIATAEIEAEWDDFVINIRVIWQREIVEPLIALMSRLQTLYRERQERRGTRV